MNDLLDTSLLDTLAQVLAQIGRDRGGPALAYIEAGENWLRGSVFVAHSKSIEWIGPPNSVLNPIAALWEMAPPDKKWMSMTMFVENGEFRVSFDYGEQWSPDENEGDRRDPIVRAHFGDKPIYYPPLEGAEAWDAAE